jgi:hypothetical protein
MTDPTSNGKGHGPVVPKSQEEIDEEREAAETQAREHAAMVKRAHAQARLLTLSSVITTAGGSLLAFALAPGPTAWGVLLGSSVMTANLYVLALLLGKVLLEEENRGLFSVMLGASFLGLAGASAWVVRAYPDMALGFGLGLSVPAMAGMVFSLFRRGTTSG